MTIMPWCPIHLSQRSCRLIDCSFQARRLNATMTLTLPGAAQQDLYSIAPFSLRLLSRLHVPPPGSRLFGFAAQVRTAAFRASLHVAGRVKVSPYLDRHSGTPDYSPDAGGPAGARAHS